MNESKLRDGDFVPNGIGDFCRLDGSDALLQRVLFKLTARRGSFPFLPELGSQLYRLGREKPAARKALCVQYVRQALADEDVMVNDVSYEQQGDSAQVNVTLQWQGQTLKTTAQLGGISG